MNQLPIFLNLEGRRVLVVGGGSAAARKAELVARAGGRLRVVAPDLVEDFDDLKKTAGFEHIDRELRETDLAGCTLAFGAAEIEDVNHRLHGFAEATNTSVNIVDDPDRCSFFMPTIIDRSPIVLAVSSGGKAPILARALKARLESLVPATYGKLADLAGAYRDRVKRMIPSAAGRRRFWEALIQGPVAESVMAGQFNKARSQLDELLADAASGKVATEIGEVFLVGTGPGDPDLLTFRALRLMQQADVVLYDRLIGDGILNLVRRDAERIYVGKMAKDHTLPQEEISALLARLAKEGKRVLRLKGGDPFIFGRGGEEIELLASEGIPFQVVPGVTAAAGCAAYSGIPLTHRDHAQACVFATGHGKNGAIDLNWQALVQPNQTVVIYMGLSALDRLAVELIDHGAPADKPAAVIDNGTRPDQQVVTGTLANIADNVANSTIKGPALLVVGDVVTLHETLAWFRPRASGTD